MCKRFLAMALLPILCGTLWACDSDDSKSGSEAEGEDESFHMGQKINFARMGKWSET